MELEIKDIQLAEQKRIKTKISTVSLSAFKMPFEEENVTLGWNVKPFTFARDENCFSFILNITYGFSLSSEKCRKSYLFCMVSGWASKS